MSHYRPVGWSGDGGVRETMRVELTSGGGAFLVVWGERCKLPHRGLGQLCNFYNVEVTKHRIIIIIKVGEGGGGGAVHFRSDTKNGGGGGGGAVHFRSDTKSGRGGGGGQSASGWMPFFGTQKIRYRL